MKRFMFWWVPKIIHHWIWLLFHRSIVQLTFPDPFGAEYIWSQCQEQSGTTIEHDSKE